MEERECQLCHRVLEIPKESRVLHKYGQVYLVQFPTRTKDVHEFIDETGNLARLQEI